MKKKNKNKKIEINKKRCSTIKKYYGLNYYLLSVDDDIIYRKDYIELFRRIFPCFTSRIRIN